MSCSSVDICLGNTSAPLSLKRIWRGRWEQGIAVIMAGAMLGGIMRWIGFALWWVVAALGLLIGGIRLGTGVYRYRRWKRGFVGKKCLICNRIIQTIPDSSSRLCVLSCGAKPVEWFFSEYRNKWLVNLCCSQFSVDRLPGVGDNVRVFYDITSNLVLAVDVYKEEKNA